MFLSNVFNVIIILFSECECDYVGSTDLQCEPTGQCPCRPNVEGRRCDRCKENTHNKLVGCISEYLLLYIYIFQGSYKSGKLYSFCFIDCPPCYNLVQDAANNHRAKLAELEELLKALRENPQLLNDEEFVAKLKEVEGKVDKLLEDALSATGKLIIYNLYTHLFYLYNFLNCKLTFYWKTKRTVVVWNAPPSKLV